MAVTRAKAKTTDKMSPAVASRAKEATMRKAPAKKAAAKKAVVQVSKSKAKSKKKVHEESEEESEEGLDAYEDEDKAINVEKKRIFRVFKADENLDEGLCVIRSLGDRTYELVNLKNVPRVDMATEEMGEIIKAIPGRREMLAISVEQWEDAKLKAELAVKSADGQIFRFLKLPIELRYKIYEEVLISAKGLHKTKYCSYPGLGLLLSCHSIYEESLQFVYRNSFGLTGNEIASLSKSNSVFPNWIKELSFWWSGSVKSSATFRWIAKFPQLKILRLCCGFRAAMISASENKNKLYQDENTIKGFSKGHGFDSLVQIRGLEKVIVEKTFGASEMEKKALEEFLMRTLTLPKEPIQPKAKATRQRKTLNAAAAAGKS